MVSNLFIIQRVHNLMKKVILTVILFLALILFVNAQETQTQYCDEAGFFCVASQDCTNENTLGYYCSGLSNVCCKEKPELKSCEEMGGEVCNSMSVCDGLTTTDLNGEACCLLGCKGPTEYYETTECEEWGYACEDYCGNQRQEEQYTCNEDQVCCSPKVNQESGLNIKVERKTRHPIEDIMYIVIYMSLMIGGFLILKSKVYKTKIKEVLIEKRDYRVPLFLTIIIFILETVSISQNANLFIGTIIFEGDLLSAFIDFIRIFIFIIVLSEILKLKKIPIELKGVILAVIIAYSLFISIPTILTNFLSIRDFLFSVGFYAKEPYEQLYIILTFIIVIITGILVSKLFKSKEVNNNTGK